MMTVTQWFGPHTRPVHVGPYESTVLDDGRLADLAAHWDGKCWRWEDGSGCVFQNRTWRGLAEKPV